GTGVLTAMFSELASTSPTAPTVRSKPAVGGGSGGGVDVYAERHFHDAAAAKINAPSASSGKPNFFIASPSSLLLRLRPTRRGRHSAAPIRHLRCARRPSGRWCRQS